VASSKNRAGLFLEGSITASDAAFIVQHRQSQHLCMTGVKAPDLDFISCMTGLQSLHLYKCEIEHKQLAQFKSLDELFINGTKIRALDFLPEMTFLKSFAIGYAPLIETVPDISACTQLRALKFFHCKRLADIKNVALAENLERFEVLATPQKPGDLVFVMKQPKMKAMSGAFGSQKLDAEFHALLAAHGLQYG
jgi:hypothetical protein